MNREDFIGWQMIVPKAYLSNITVFGSDDLSDENLKWISEKIGGPGTVENASVSIREEWIICMNWLPPGYWRRSRCFGTNVVQVKKGNVSHLALDGIYLPVCFGIHVSGWALQKIYCIRSVISSREATESPSLPKKGNRCTIRCSGWIKAIMSFSSRY